MKNFTLLEDIASAKAHPLGLSKMLKPDLKPQSIKRINTGIACNTSLLKQYRQVKDFKYVCVCGIEKKKKLV